MCLILTCVVILTTIFILPSISLARKDLSLYSYLFYICVFGNINFYYSLYL
jgi:hypothetical protein